MKFEPILKDISPVGVLALSEYFKTLEAQGYLEGKMITGICKECGKPCEGHKEEIGIGGYEYLGHKGNDRRLGYFSDCCNAEMREVEE